MTMRVRWLLVACVCGALVAGCGQQGALYLPEKSQDTVTTPENQPATDAGAGAQGATTQPVGDGEDSPPRTGRDPARNSESR